MESVRLMCHFSKNSAVFFPVELGSVVTADFFVDAEATYDVPPYDVITFCPRSWANAPYSTHLEK